MKNSDCPILETKGLSYAYPGGVRALNGVDFALREGEKLALVGANGSGKSTLLLHLSGCVAAREGQISLRGVSVGTNLRLLRESVGLIFQEPDDQLFMPLVLEDVAFGLVARGMGAPKAQERAMQVLGELGVSHLIDRPPHRLSGGEKRMVALAGILATHPSVLALDEPSAALDPRARRRVIETLRSLSQPMIVATHDLDLALDICGSAVIMNGGGIAARGPAPEVLRDASLLMENGLEPPLSFSHGQN